MQQQMAQNPQMMQQIMQSPMMQSMLSNPDMMRSMIQMNPAMQQLMEQNPQLREVLNDPETMRQHMQAMSNPALMNEMMRQQDRAMANIEAHPQGFNALARMFSEVQQPLQEAQQQEAQQRSGGGVGSSVSSAGAGNGSGGAVGQGGSGSSSLSALIPIRGHARAQLGHTAGTPRERERERVLWHPIPLRHSQALVVWAVAALVGSVGSVSVGSAMPAALAVSVSKCGPQ